MIPLYAFATSFCALAYQQLMAYALMDATSNFVLSQSVTLGVFLFAMGVGSLRAERGGKLGWRRLLRVELIIGLLGILSIGFVQVSEILVAYLALPHANAALLLINTPYLFAIGYHTGHRSAQRPGGRARPGPAHRASPTEATLWPSK